MLQEKSTETARINARKTDIFDVFNFKHYIGPNPYLDTAALVFDLAVTGASEPLPIAHYQKIIGDRYPQLLHETFSNHAQLFGRTTSEVAKLDMGLHFQHWNVKPFSHFNRISIEALHARSARAVVYAVWDWFEAINQNQDFPLEAQMGALQSMFRQSVYGGPTVYSLMRSASQKGIPVFYLWDEGLMQYGYGKKLVRGSATTFDSDSHLDSDFTTRKDDCKAFLATLGFPVPKGDIVSTENGAVAVAKEIGYPVAIKPVVGHKGIGVTADVRDAEELQAAFKRAVKAIPETESVRVIVENSIKGSDFRLLCVDGKFVSATERRPAWVTGDGNSTIRELIRRENRKSERLDTPTSALSKIQSDEAMEMYLAEQGLSLDSVLEGDRTVALRKVANLSAGGVSIDATRTIHPDNIVLAQDIALHFRLTCLGVDVVTETLAKSWKTGNFGILEINAAPGIFMHLNPAVGEGVDVPSHIIETFFDSGKSARIPIITFNRISVHELQEIIDHILLQHPDWTIGAVCRGGLFVNRSEKVLNKNYHLNVQSLLRNPKLDLLIAEYPENILEAEGMFYRGSNMVVLDNPGETEMMLARESTDDDTVVVREGSSISIRRQGLIEQYTLGDDEPFTRVYLKEIGTVL
ncbi:acetate--CoA ligase family protein [Microcoleus sp. LAD1_D5]|uniref:ATP-binding protein n=1 Tax=unclassified Microcoleus TaxID=2642155 RepID=UPI002FD79312